jgi:hypothetical protein
MHSPSAKEVTLAQVDQSIAVRSTGLDIEIRWKDSALSDLAATAALVTTSRVCIVLENIRGSLDAAMLHLNLTALDSPDERDPDHEAALGAVALFGLRLASLPKPDGTTGGMTSHLDITQEARALIATALATNTKLSLSIRPARPLPALSSYAKFTVNALP